MSNKTTRSTSAHANRHCISRIRFPQPYVHRNHPLQNADKGTICVNVPTSTVATAMRCMHPRTEIPPILEQYFTSPVSLIRENSYRLKLSCSTTTPPCHFYQTIHGYNYRRVLVVQIPNPLTQHPGHTNPPTQTTKTARLQGARTDARYNSVFLNHTPLWHWHPNHYEPKTLDMSSPTQIHTIHRITIHSQ